MTLKTWCLLAGTLTFAIILGWLVWTWFDVMDLERGSPLHNGQDRLTGGIVFPTDANEEKGKHGEQVTESDHPPIGRRFLFLCLSLSIGFVLGHLGWQYVDDHRLLAGSALVGLGLFLAACGLALWWLTGFIWTWNWMF